MIDYLSAVTPIYSLDDHQMITVIMECMYCNRMFSTKHSLATHKSRYHNTDFQSECEDNESLIRLMMKAVLDGDVVLTAVEKKRLKPTRESIRKIVNCEKSLSEVFDKKLEQAIKLIIKLVKQKFPTLIFESPSKSYTSRPDDPGSTSSEEYDSEGGSDSSRESSEHSN